jgi:RNA polymerase sigma factor (sigma-70 family)
MAINDDEIPDLLARLRAGDAQARQEMFVYVEEKFWPLAHKLLRIDFPRVGLHAETGDILHEALCRLIPYLERSGAEVGSSAERFYGLAATVLRHTLIDAARKHFGSLQSHPISEGIEANHPLLQESSGLNGWREGVRVHELVARLPPEERHVIELSLYLGFGTGEIAKQVGVHAGTISRRLTSAKEKLGRMLREDERRSDRD